MKNKTLKEYFKKKTLSNKLYLKGKTFKNTEFEDFILNPTKKTPAFLSDVIFDNCKVKYGCDIGINVTLSNVLIKQLSVPTLHICSETKMKNLVIEGKGNPSMVWIKKVLEDQDKQYEHCDNSIALDISNYSGEVDITGLSSDLVKINLNEHVIIDAQLFNNVDWKKLNFNPFSFWKIMSKKAYGSKSKEGIFNLPLPNERIYEVTMTEMEILQKEGFI